MQCGTLPIAYYVFRLCALLTLCRGGREAARYIGMAYVESELSEIRQRIAEITAVAHGRAYTAAEAARRVALVAEESHLIDNLP